MLLHHRDTLIDRHAEHEFKLRILESDVRNYLNNLP